MFKWFKKKFYDEKLDKQFATPVTREAVRRAQTIDPRPGLYGAWVDKGLVPRHHRWAKHILQVHYRELYETIEIYSMEYSRRKEGAYYMIPHILRAWRQLDRQGKTHVHRSLPIVGIMLIRLERNDYPHELHEKESK